MGLSDRYLQPADVYAPEWPDECPDCHAPAGDEVHCQRCGAVLDSEEAEAEARQDAYERDVDRARGA